MTSQPFPGQQALPGTAPAGPGAGGLRTRIAGLAQSRLGGPLQVLLRAAGGATAALALSWVHRNHDPGVLCLLRRFTGIPCPGCGSTTVFMELGQGHWGAAVAANPVTVVVALGLLIAPLGPGRWWWNAPVRQRNALIALAAAVSWVWQLHRLGISRP